MSIKEAQLLCRGQWRKVFAVRSKEFDPQDPQLEGKQFLNMCKSGLPPLSLSLSLFLSLINVTNAVLMYRVAHLLASDYGQSRLANIPLILFSTFLA